MRRATAMNGKSTLWRAADRHPGQQSLAPVGGTAISRGHSRFAPTTARLIRPRWRANWPVQQFQVRDSAELRPGPLATGTVAGPRSEDSSTRPLLHVAAEALPCGVAGPPAFQWRAISARDSPPPRPRRIPALSASPHLHGPSHRQKSGKTPKARRPPIHRPCLAAWIAADRCRALLHSTSPSATIAKIPATSCPPSVDVSTPSEDVTIATPAFLQRFRRCDEVRQLP